MDAQLTGTSWQGRIRREIVRDDGKVSTGLVAQAKRFWERNLVRPGHVTEKVLKQRSGCESGRVLCERERLQIPVRQVDAVRFYGCSSLSLETSVLFLKPQSPFRSPTMKSARDL